MIHDLDKVWILECLEDRRWIDLPRSAPFQAVLCKDRVF